MYRISDGSLFESFLSYLSRQIVFQPTEVEMMKERFAKLLLGEDMSGGGKGVCTALAISNAITNLSGIKQASGDRIVNDESACSIDNLGLFTPTVCP